MKKILLLVCVLAMLFSATAYANEETEYTLSLDAAIKMARENDPQFVSADNKIIDAERQLKQAYKDQNSAKNVIVELPSGISTVAIQKGYYVEQAKIAVENAKREKSKAEGKSAYSITEKYYSLKLAQSLAQSANNAYYLALENKSVMEKQFSLGLVAELDVKNAVYSANQAKSSYDKYMRNLDIARKDLCISLQIEENSILNLTDDIEYTEFTANINEDINLAMDTRSDIYTLKSLYDQSNNYLIIAELTGTDSAQYSSAKQSLIQNEYTYNNTKKLIGLSINANYNSILDAKDGYFLALEKKALKEQEYGVAKLQYELGMITNIQLTSSLNSVTQSEIELENAKLTYKLAVEKYGYEITIGL